MFKSSIIKEEPEEGEISFLEKARMLITSPPASAWRSDSPGNPAQSSFSLPQRRVDEISHSNDISRSGLHHDGRVASIAEADVDPPRQHESPSTPSQSERAAFLRAQLIDAQKAATPGPAASKEGVTKPPTTLQVSRSRDRNLSADIEAMISTEKSAQNSRKVSSGNSTYETRGDEQVKKIAQTHVNGARAGNTLPKDRRDSGNMASNSSLNYPLYSPKSGQDLHGRRAERRESNSDNKHEQAEKDRDMRLRSAEQHKGSYRTGLPDPRPGSAGDGKNDKQRGVSSISLKKPVGNPASGELDASTLPTDIQQWLILTNWYNEEFRKKALENYKKKLYLQQQLRELDQSDLELRTSLGTQPTIVPSSADNAATKSPTTALAPNKPEAESGAVVKWTPTNAKRPRDEDKPHDPEPKKAMKIDTRAAERRSPDRPRPETRSGPRPSPDRRTPHRLTPPPPSARELAQSGRYDSYRPGPGMESRDRDRERERERERERDWDRGRHDRPDEARPPSAWTEPKRERESERPRGWGASPEPGQVGGGELADDPRRDGGLSASAKKKQPYQGFPIVPCRYFRQGHCHRGDRCTFLHE